MSFPFGYLPFKILPFQIFLVSDLLVSDLAPTSSGVTGAALLVAYLVAGAVPNRDYTGLIYQSLAEVTVDIPGHFVPPHSSWDKLARISSRSEPVERLPDRRKLLIQIEKR
jgi:hypothetical protein